MELLIECVGATNLSPPNPKTKESNSYPFCAVRNYYNHGKKKVLKNEERIIHRTKYVPKTLSPIWTIKTNSLFLMKVSMERKSVGEDSSSKLKKDNGNRSLKLISSGLRFEIYNSTSSIFDDSIGECWGYVNVSNRTLRDKSIHGERKEYSLWRKVKGTDIPEEGKGILALRIRRATNEDKKFIGDYSYPSSRGFFKSTTNKKMESQNRNVVNDDDGKDKSVKEVTDVNAPYLDFDFKKQKVPQPHFLKSSDFRIERTLTGGAVKKFRVKPCPDPQNVKETEWMTLEEIIQTSMSPSKHWIKKKVVKECSLFGTLYVEIIGCEGLPNMDATRFNKNTTDMTDTFVAILYEDSMVRTDVIFDALRPRWMPWCQRAFAFPIKHPMSILTLGVFDFDYDVVTGASSNFVGRAVVEVSRFYSDTVYVLWYPLHAHPNHDDDVGKICLRLRLEGLNEKESLIESFTTPPRFHVNMPSTNGYSILKKLCRGPVNMDKATRETIYLYKDELTSNFQVFIYIFDALIQVLLWRGQLKLTISRGLLRRWLFLQVTDEFDDDDDDSNEHTPQDIEDKNIHLSFWFPIHSFLLFQGVVTVIECPSLLPSFISLALSWLMGTIMFNKSHSPSPWSRCMNIREITSAALQRQDQHQPKEEHDNNNNNNSTKRSISIQPHEGEDEVVIAEAVDAAMRNQFTMYVTAFKDAVFKFKNEYAQTDFEALAIETKDTEWDWTFLGPMLSPVHYVLQTLCNLIRMIRNVVTCQAPSYSYIVTVTCFVIGVISIFIPWNLIFLWFCRIMAWSLLGPWMKVVDIYFVNKSYKSHDELERTLGDEVSKVEIKFDGPYYEQLARLVRIACEDSEKLKDMRQYRFGPYSLKVPSSVQSRFAWLPLPESSASPFDVDGPGEKLYDEHYFGQKLVGNMIHKQE